MKCQARIMREYKKKRADSLWPEYHTGQPSQWLDQYPEVCGGDVTVQIKAGWSGSCACSGSSELELEASCSRCASPYWPGRYELQGRISRGEINITEWLE
jgi:hypothetical protein